MAKVVCPWWLGYLLANPLRKVMHDPDRILEAHLKEGMVALDVGCAMGFFTLPMARLVGPSGRVVAVDLQEKMIRSLKRRAEKAEIAGRIECRVCTSDSLGIGDLAGTIDFALAFAVLHEMPNIQTALSSIVSSLKIGGLLLIAEPTGHVNADEFDRTVATALGCGMKLTDRPSIKRTRSTLMSKSS